MMSFPCGRRKYDSQQYGATGSCTTSCKSTIGDLASAKAFHSGCACFESTVNVMHELKGEPVVCTCQVSCRWFPHFLGQARFSDV